MKAKHVSFLIFLCFLFLFSCSNKKNENKSASETEQTNPDTITPPVVTILADLPDSSKPVVTLLEIRPRPLTITVPRKKSVAYTISTAGEKTKINLEPPVSVFPPLLKDDKGDLIKDKNGNPFILGEGGISSFTTYTTDNGLALDAINCSHVDQFGNLWLGTAGGVSRFDGKNFTTFTAANGLANNNVLCIKEDKSGNLWFGTFRGGVSCYDGKSFITYTTSQGLVNNNVFSIEEDKSGNLWFGSFGDGVSRFDSNRATSPCNKNACEHNLENPQDLELHNKEIAKHFTTFSTSQGLANDIVFSIAEDKTGNLWFGTGGGGVSRYDGKNFTTFSTAQGLANNRVFNMLEDKTGDLWFCTEGGACRFDGNQSKDPCIENTCNHNLQNHQDLDEHNRKIAKYFNSFSTNQGLASNNIWCIAQDESGDIWFGTFGSGVSRYDGNSFTTFTTEQGLSNNTITSITKDKSGNLWFGTFGGGLNRFNGESFVTFNTSHGLSHNNVLSIAQDKSGNIWLGTGGNMLCRYDGKSYTTYSSAQGFANDIVYSITEDKFGNLWFGTFGSGVCCYNGKSFTTFTTAQGLVHNTIKSSTEDKKGNLWFGSYSDGLSRFDGKSFTTFTTAQGLAGNAIYDITEDKSGNIWIGTYGGGLSLYDGKSFTNFTTSQGLVSNNVICITEDKTGNLWIGTENGVSMLSLINREKLLSRDFFRNDNLTEELFQNYTTNDGIPDNYVAQVISYDENRLYLGTNAGICEFNYENSKWHGGRIFNSATGYPVKDVNTGQGTLLKDDKGKIWIATGSEKTALVRFDPAAVAKNNQPPRIIIQQLRIDETPVCWYSIEKFNNSPDAPFTRSDSIALAQQEVMTFGKILSVKERDSLKTRNTGIKFDGISGFYPLPENLILPHRHNSVSFDFAAVETGINLSVRYQYMLEGYSKEWSPVTNKTSAVFGNIPDGTFIFKLKAKSQEGIWGDPVTYTFTVLPPWWRTWYMYVLYLISMVTIIVSFIRWRIGNLKKEKIVLEKKITEATQQIRKEKERAEQSEKYKQQFLANMSHEIRTPMNAVMGMTELVLDTPLNTRQKGYLTGVKKASQNLLHIINDILDISKIEAGKIELEQIDFSLKEVADQVRQTLNHKAEEKGIQLMIDIDNTIPDVVIGDPSRLNQVLINLAGNAIKFTEKGSVMIEISKADGHKTKFAVIDTGIGIPGEKLKTIFESFSQANASDSRKYGGTGLGLTISKQFIELMGGELKVESTEGSGTIFSFVLNLPKGLEINLQKQNDSNNIDGNILDGLRILLADDNEDNRIVARDTLESKSNISIIEAVNGNDVLDKHEQNNFDVILMDVQMPVMDGYEATRKIRNSFSPPKNQIPIIALTASVIRSDLDKCKQAGMTDYIPKPFKSSQLISVIAKATGREIKYIDKNNVGLKNAKVINAGITDLAYLEEFCEGDKLKMQKYINIFLESAPELTRKLNGALRKNNFEEIANQIHGFKTKWIMMGMEEAQELAIEIEFQCRKEIPDQLLIKENTIKLISIVESATIELKRENGHI